MDSSFTRETLRFYFSFNDPYSFLITPAIKTISQNYRVEIEYVPLADYDAENVFSDDESVRSYHRRDLDRFAKKAGRKLDYLDHSIDSSKACRGKYFADKLMLGAKYINLVFAMRWIGAGDISVTADLVEGLKYLEFDKRALVDALESDTYNAALEAGRLQSVDDRVIGAPFMVFRDEPFYGPDRLEDLENTIKSDPSMIIHHDASYSVIQPGELKEILDHGKPVFVLDIRIPKDFGLGHIPGANCLPAKIVHRNLDRMDREWKIVVTGDGSADESEIAFMLAGAGFRSVSVLAGGYPAWKGEKEKGLENWHDKLKPR